MRPWKALLLLTMFGANCQECQSVCCELADGTHATWNRGRCAREGGVEQDAFECDDVGDPDGDDTDAADTDPVVDEQLRRCQDFCTAIRVVCPEDLACEESCMEHATEIPSDEAIACAEDAQACNETGACWNLLGL